MRLAGRRPRQRTSEVPPELNPNRAMRVLRNMTRDWIAIWMAMAGPRPETENTVTEMFVMARIGMRTADSTIAASEIT